MSTRSVVTVRDVQGQGSDVFHLYRHSDGYPTAVLPEIALALPYAWPLPRFEAADFAAALVAAWKKPAVTAASLYGGRGKARKLKMDPDQIVSQGGGIYFTTTFKDHGDLAWRYEITRAKHNSELIVKVLFECDGSTKAGVRDGWFEVFYGRLKDALPLAGVIEEAGGKFVRIEAQKGLPAAPAEALV